MFKTYISFLFLFLFGFELMAQDQEVSIEFIERSKTVGGELDLNITISGGNLYTTSEFPNFKGLIKASKVIKHTKETINGDKIPVHLIKQTYVNELGGKIILPETEITINGEVFSLEARTFIFPEKTELEPELSVPLKEEAVLLLTTDKSKYHVGEPIQLSLKVLVHKGAKNQWEFPVNLSAKLDEIAAKLKPKDCLDNRKIITDIKGQEETYQNKIYNVYTVFENIYYPLIPKKIDFKAQVLEMIILKNKIKVKQNLNANAKSVTVISLPDHPLKEKVAVGKFSISETIKGSKLKATGKAFEYNVNVSGTGNFTGISVDPIQNTNFDLKIQNVKLNQNPGSKAGNKSITISLTPKIEGDFKISDIFEIVYFNTEKERYDTLRPRKKVSTTGDAIKIEAEAEKDIFADIENLSSVGTYLNYKTLFKVIANVLWLVALLFFLRIIIKR